MKTTKIIVLSISILAMVSCQNKTPDVSSDVRNDKGASISGADTPLVTPVPANGKYPEMIFEEETHDFGTIDQGEIVTTEFEFENAGGSDLIITEAKGSCGCTVPEFPREAIKPGETSQIKVSFNSSGKSGEQTKTVTLFCNTKEGKKVLHIKSNIEVPEKD